MSDRTTDQTENFASKLTSILSTAKINSAAEEKPKTLRLGFSIPEDVAMDIAMYLLVGADLVDLKTSEDPQVTLQNFLNRHGANVFQQYLNQIISNDKNYRKVQEGINEIRTSPSFEPGKSEMHKRRKILQMSFAQKMPKSEPKSENQNKAEPT